MKGGVLQSTKSPGYPVTIVLILLMACVAAGVIGSSAAFARDLLRIPIGLFGLTSLVALAVFVVGCSYSIRSVSRMGEGAYMSAIVAGWLITRGTIVLVFPKWPLLGDEDNLHKFVGLLATHGFNNQNLAQLSTWYDYPVWLSRAFPIYYPLRIIFHDADVTAVRYANVFMGAATLCLLYLLAKELVGKPYARCAAFLYFIFPFHFVDALSYTPQIPGTLLVTAAILLIIRNLGARDVRPTVIYTGVAVGILLFAVRIQRGGFDMLILAGYPILLALYATGRQRAWRTLWPAVATTGVAFLVWAPPTYWFESWIQVHDAHHLRSQVLGFMTRGSNPVSLGEYLPRYESLDAISAPEEKNRLLRSVLATEIARGPAITLGALPLIKAAKLFSIGHASMAVGVAEQAGYLRLSQVLRGSSDVYALFLLSLCLCGLVAAAAHPLLGARMAPVCWFALSAGLAVILFWEAQPTYSHGFQSVLMILAALGVGTFRTYPRRTVRRVLGRVGPLFAAAMARVAFLWILFAAGLYLVSVSAKDYIFTDMRGVRASINGLPVPVQPLNRWTQSWEQQVLIPAGTALPAKLRLEWLGKSPASSMRMSLWTEADAFDCGCRVEVADHGRVSTYSPAELAAMRRGDWAINSSLERVIEITILPNNVSSSLSLTRTLEIAMGYAF